MMPLPTTSRLTSQLAAIVFAAIGSPYALAEEEPTPNYQEETLTGDWGGKRTALYKQGVNLGFAHTSDVHANLSGGLKRGAAWLGYTEFTLDLDFDKLAGWKDTTAFVHYHSDLGSKFNANYVGSSAGINGNEVIANSARFYQAWVEKKFFNQQLAVLAGYYASDAEFQINETAVELLNPVYGVTNEFALSGRVGPPAFPFGALGVRVKYTAPSNNFYAMGALTDGVADDPNNPRGSHIKLGRGDGTYSVVEFGYTPQTEVSEVKSPEAKPGEEQAEIFNKTAIGFWFYSTKYPHLDEEKTSKHRSQGAYLIAERSLYIEPGHASQGLAGFVRMGVAPQKTEQIDWTTSLGLRYHGLFDGRDDDVLAAAVNVNHAGSVYQRLNDSDRYETDYELTYSAKIKPWLVLQPDLQYIVNPNMDKSLGNAWVLGLRTDITF